MRWLRRRRERQALRLRAAERELSLARRALQMELDRSTVLEAENIILEECERLLYPNE